AARRGLRPYYGRTTTRREPLNTEKPGSRPRSAAADGAACLGYHPVFAPMVSWASMRLRTKSSLNAHPDRPAVYSSTHRWTVYLLYSPAKGKQLKKNASSPRNTFPFRWRYGLQRVAPTRLENNQPVADGRRA